MQQRNTDNLMPNSRSRRRLVLAWLRRERARRSWVSVMIAAARTRHVALACPVIQSDRTRAEVAVWTWQTVSSGFFPPPLLMDLGQEQVADGCKDQVSPQRPPGADLEVTQAQVPLLVLKATLHGPTRERHVPQHLHGRSGRRVRYEVLEFLVILGVAGHDQPVRPRRQTVPLQVERPRRRQWNGGLAISRDCSTVTENCWRQSPEQAKE